MLQDHVICQTDPDLWFSSNTDEKLLAIDLCSSCYFKDSCIGIAIQNKESFGIWGGIDFSEIFVEEPLVPLCRKGLHELPEGGNCYECRRISQRKYDREKKKPMKKVKPRKNVLGGYCTNEHPLNEDTVTIRSSDQAILCKKCIANNKTKNSKSFHLQGDFQ